MVGGTVELGVIDATAAAALKCLSGVIRLPEGNATGYGRLHIHENASRMTQIKGLGFATAAQFVAEIAANWTDVIAANEPNRLVLVCPKGGYGLRLIVQRHEREQLRCWSTVTALPGRKTRPVDVLFSRKKTTEG